MIPITEGDENIQTRKKRKKSFWFEFAEEKGLDPHKSAWSDYLMDKKRDRMNTHFSNKINFCSRCGHSLQIDAKFCERCGQRIKSL